MPTYEYQCPFAEPGDTFEIFFKTFTEAEKHKETHRCPQCTATAHRKVSMPLQAHLYGDPAGYYKPSPTKRFSTKTVSALEGNTSSAG